MELLTYKDTFAALLAALAGFLVVHWQRARMRPASAPPLGTNWPVIGMLPTLICQMVNFHDYLAERLIKHGGTVEMQGPWFSDMDSIITSDPANIRHIMSGNFRNYPKGPIMKEIFEPLGPNGIFAVDGESWVFQRKTLQLLMKNKRYRLLMEKAAHDKLENGIFPVLDHLAENESKIVDLQDVFQRFTFDVICMTVLGYNPSSLNIDLQDVPLAKAFDDIDKGMFELHVVPETMWKLQRLLGLGAEKRLAVATESFDKFLYDFISSRREKIVRQQTRMDKEELVDLLTAHIEGETRKEDVVEYSTFKDDKLLRDMVINLLAAGRSTIAVALVWFFWSMANNPRVESKVLAELAANPPAPHHSDHSSCRRRQSRLYREEEVNRLVYLHATVAETLRLYTPTPMNHKWAREADVLPSGHRVRAKTRIFVSMYAMGRMKGIWGEDCREFKPERWITERGGIRYVPSHQFTTFSGGPRSCLGKEVSLIQLKMVVAAILWRYKFQVVEGHRVSYTMSTVLQMENELRVSVSRRST